MGEDTDFVAALVLAAVISLWVGVAVLDRWMHRARQRRQQSEKG